MTSHEAIKLSRRALLVSGAAGSAAVLFGLGGLGGAGAAGAPPRRINALVRFEADGAITLVNPAIEMGQGSSTALAQVLADALDADWRRIRVEPAPYGDDYGSPHFGMRLVTADSASTRAFWPVLREAGAQARAVLIWNAMQRWQCAADAVHTEAGQLLHRDGRRIAYADLAPQAELPGLLANLPKPAPAPSRLVGQALPRIDLVDKLAGRAVYGVDARSEGALVAVLLPPERLGAKLLEPGDAAARALPGVVNVLPLPGESAPIAVVARDTWSALQGRAALQARWSPPAELYDSERALQRFADIARQGAPDAHVVRQTGAAGHAPPAPARRLQSLILSRHVTHAALEPINAQATPAWLNQGADIVASTQAPSLDMRRAAQTAKRPPPVFAVQSTLVGGAFGRRVDNDAAGAAAWLALQLKAPVQVLQFVGDDVAHGQVRTIAAQQLEADLDDQGRITRWLHRTVGSATTARMFPERFQKEGFDQTLVDGSEHAYDIPQQRIESIHRPLPVACGFLRGVGAGFNVFGIETLVDEAAALAGRDPLAYRLAMLREPRARRVIEALGDHTPAPGTAAGHAYMGLRSSHIALRALVTRDAAGHPRIERLQFVVDAGLIVNPELARTQIEGAALMGWSIARQEALDFVDGRAVQRALADYTITRLPELPPHIDCRFIDATQGEPRGVGEIALPLVAPAVANAWARLTGRRLRALPLLRG
ncbi:xanthine dehydrogenase family protein molybdopterin-binding subunit [Aquincola sp. S2]|uniref:Xanthine dehydrogenase family protein molybdopterin-binding subunit n=1 Tax=Pseudaquabacterium terrae TaxID=2732868 RepID=A0ABX2ENB3_9BURK|nr:molybdopterin cofactor-binding domain-containing protein [Aquabacterium terrae]NRF70185.1 xanthine dehydrogenase family protein molybdopterin-binding subunit [Aquabacterium terrae]